MTASRRLRAVVRGRVQGVGFRYSTEDEANRLGLAGWVRNLPDGGVELEAEGEQGALDRLLAFLRQGPPAARVQTVVEEWLPPAGLARPFQIKKTF
jgi:acylphosphatase